MTGAAIVYVDTRHLTLTPPNGGGVHHVLDRSKATWPTHVYDEEISKRVGYRATRRVGIERQVARCGREIYRSTPDDEPYRIIRRMEAFRADVARLFTRPCKGCHR